MSTIPSRKSRALRCAGKSFRWTVRSGKGHLIGNSGPGLSITVQEDGQSSVLQARLWSKAFAAMHDYDQEHGQHRATLRPSDVEKLVLHAIESGWDPASKTPFTLVGSLDLGEYTLG